MLSYQLAVNCYFPVSTINENAATLKDLKNAALVAISVSVTIWQNHSNTAFTFHIVAIAA